MNCECVFVSKTDRNDQARLEALARWLAPLEDEIELYPVALSRITRDIPSYSMHHSDVRVIMNGAGRKTTLRAGNLVLFVQGKYHYMSKSAIRRHLPQAAKNLLIDFQIVFPDADGTFFEDITEY